MVRFEIAKQVPISHRMVGNPVCLEPKWKKTGGNKVTENSARQVESSETGTRYFLCVSLVFSTEPGRQSLLVNIC